MAAIKVRLGSNVSYTSLRRFVQSSTHYETPLTFFSTETYVNITEHDCVHLHFCIIFQAADHHIYQLWYNCHNYDTVTSRMVPAL